jgi:subtilisin family serine protease/subtilisin-like proprotein convertase family protein
MPCRIAFVVVLGWLSGLGASRAQSISPSAVTHFVFREPRLARYHISPNSPVSRVKTALAQWIEAWPDNGSTNSVQFGARVVLQIQPGQRLEDLFNGRPVQLSRTLRPGLFILQAPDVETALLEANRLAADRRVIVSYPVTRRLKRLSNPYAPRPNDPLFFQAGQPGDQWQANLENRNTNGTPTGIDLNIRAAWPLSEGEGVLVAVADEGFELDHPDLVDRTGGAPHYNFVTVQPDGVPLDDSLIHGTPVAGLIGATANNGIGISGVAPKVRLASWVIFGPNEVAVSEEALMDMFQYQSNVVRVQNHSWGKSGNEQVPVSVLEDMAISNAVYFGRSGRGVVLVRAAGNGRVDGNDANEDGYLADPRVIAVAAARLDGRVAGYSSPGANILVSAPGGDDDPHFHPCLPNSPRIVTTDDQGSAGYNPNPSPAGDYAVGARAFAGTSAATPQISGVAALMLAANTNLTYRDVQQILILSSRFTDLSDPTLQTNAAGFRVSHNLGFGVPDAGAAVSLARSWSNRPPPTTVTYAATNSAAAIPDLGLRLVTMGGDVPTNVQSIIALPGAGPQFDTTTALMPLVDVGIATNSLTADLRGKAALIQRGSNYFCQKIQFAADAGAAFAVVYDNVDGNVRIAMGGTDLTPIPSVFISQNDGEALRDFLAATPQAQSQLSLTTTNYTFKVAETLQCEFVGVRVNTDHTARGDLRIVLTSPGGTRSVLQRLNEDTAAGPMDWTYYSVQHFYESSYGTWTLSVSDQNTNGVGSVLNASLMITGVPITDTDHDGLDDDWERHYFNTLAYGAADDPDHDGYSNAREQLMGTNPNAPAVSITLDMSRWDDRLARLSWEGNTNTVYLLSAGFALGLPLTTITNLPGQFPQTEWFVPFNQTTQQFFRIQATPQ